MTTPTPVRLDTMALYEATVRKAIDRSRTMSASDLASARRREQQCLWYAWGRCDAGDRIDGMNDVDHGMIFAREQFLVQADYDAGVTGSIDSISASWESYKKRMLALAAEQQKGANQ